LRCKAMRTFSITLQVRKYRGNLERANPAQPRHIGWRQRRDVTPVVDDPPIGGTQELGQEIEAGGLAGTIRADQRVNGPARDPQVDFADRHKAREIPSSDFAFRE